MKLKFIHRFGTSYTAVACLALFCAISIGAWAQNGPGSGGQTGAIYVSTIVSIVPSGEDEWAGATMTLKSGQEIIIPSNFLIDLPANRLSPVAFCATAPASEGVCGEGHIAQVLANKQPDDRVIAGDVFIHKDDQDLQGIVTSIDPNEGSFTINGTTKVRLNDPDAVHTIQAGGECDAQSLNCSPDPRYTNDPSNYTFVATTGYPMCVPTPTGVELPGPGCQANSGRLGGQSAQVADAERFEPIEIGDHVTSSGAVESVNGVTFQSAHTILVGVEIATGAGQPDYVIVEEAEWDVASWANLRMRGLNIGIVTSNAQVSVYRVALNGASDALPGGSCESDQFIASTAACAAVGGTCGNQQAVPGGGGQVVKWNYDWDFIIGEGKPDRNPAAVVRAAGDPSGLLLNDSDANDSFRVISPIARDIVYKTSTFEACPTCFSVLDVSGNPAQWGIYLSPNGVGHPEWNEIDLAAFMTPFDFEGLPWAFDRRLGPDGGNEALASNPLGDFGFDPFPSSGHDPCRNVVGAAAPTICTAAILVRDACVDPSGTGAGGGGGEPTGNSPPSVPAGLALPTSVLANGGSLTLDINDLLALGVLDPDGDALTLAVLSTTTTLGGTVTEIAPGVFSFVAGAVAGDDVVDFTVTDGEFTVQSSLTITVLDDNPSLTLTIDRARCRTGRSLRVDGTTTGVLDGTATVVGFGNTAVTGGLFSFRQNVGTCPNSVTVTFGGVSATAAVAVRN